MGVANSVGFGGELCKALGLEAHRVSRIVLEVAAGEAATIQVWEYVMDEGGSAVCDVCREYELHSKPLKMPEEE